MAYRFIATCIGKSAARGDATAVTFQFSGAASPNGLQTITKILPNSVATTFAIGTTYKWYITVSGAEATAVEGAVTSNKGSSKD